MAQSPTQTRSLEILPVDLSIGEHGDAVLDLLNDYAQSPFGGGKALPDKVLAILLHQLQACPQYLGFLARLETRWVGLANCFEGFSTFQASPLLNVHDLCVRSGFRGQGIGRRLLESVIASAEDRGFCRVTLEVREDNHVARHLYERLGFEGQSDGTPMAFLTRYLNGSRHD